MDVRKAYFAGSWYPGSAAECRRQIAEFATPGLACPVPPQTALGGIVPHAGWAFSGKIGCNVIQCLRPAETFILFGRHLHSASPNYIMAKGRWATPLGDLAIDEELAGALLEEFPFTVETASRYEPDNTIELQLPFIKYFSPASKILPLGVPPSQRSLELARRLMELAQGFKRQVAVVGSTDLTHYGYNYGFLPMGTGEKALRWVREVNDRRMIDLLLHMGAAEVIEEGLESQNACCAGAAACALTAAQAAGATQAALIHYTTSYDVHPDASFVGYAGIVFYA